MKLLTPIFKRQLTRLLSVFVFFNFVMASLQASENSKVFNLSFNIHWDNSSYATFMMSDIELFKAINSYSNVGVSQEGNAILEYHFKIVNGASDKYNLALYDDLVSQLGSGFVQVLAGPSIIVPSNNPGTDPLINMSYEGGATNMFQSGGQLLADDSLTVGLLVEVDLDLLTSTAFNTASVEATFIDGISDTDNSDDYTDLNGDGTPDNETGGMGDLTFIPALPSVNIAKAVNAQVDNMDGTYAISFRHYIKNTGNTALENIQLSDDIETAFCGGVTGVSTSIISSTAATNPTLNIAYNGGDGMADINVFDGMSGLLLPGQTLVVEISADVASADIMVGCAVPYLNQSAVNALPTDGLGGPLADPATIGGVYSIFSDLSDSGTNPETTNPGAPNDSGNSNDMTPVYLSTSLGVVKAINSTVPATSGTPGNYDVTITYTIQNTGSIGISNINLIDNMASQWGDAFVGVVTAPIVDDPEDNIADMNEPTPNLSFNGDVNDNLLNGDGRLGIGSGGKFIVVTVVVEVDASETTAIGLFNQATASGIDEGPGAGVVSDLSDDNTSSPDMDDPFGDNPNGAGDDGNLDANNATPLYLPEIAITKAVTGIQSAASTTPGHFDVTYEFTVLNNGSTILENIDVTDDFATLFGSAFVEVVSGAVITNSIASNDPSSNPDFENDISTSIFLGTDGELAPGEYFTFEIQVEVDAVNLTPANNTNIATALALPTDGNGTALPDPNGSGAAFPTVSDLSDDGTGLPDNGNPAMNNNGADGASPDGMDDATPLVLPSDVVLTKGITAINPAAGFGNSLLTYELEICNTGGQTLVSVDLEDDFNSQFSAGFVSVDIMSASITVSDNAGFSDPVLNPNFSGIAPQTSLLIADAATGLLPGACATVELVVEVDNDQLSLSAVNQAEVTAVDEMTTTINDLSDDNTDLNNDLINDNPDGADPTNDPTPVPALPGIGVSKSVNMVTEGATTDQQFVTYRHIIKNAGNTVLEDLSLVDDIIATMQGGYVGTTNIAVMNTVGMTATTTLPSPSPATTVMDGINSAISGGLVEAGQEFIVDITVEVDLAAVSPPQPLNNQSTASGRPTDGLGTTLTDADGTDLANVSDMSDSGMDADGNNPGAPGDTGGFEDPTPLSLPGRIGLVKAITSFSPAATQGNYDVTIQYTLANTGSNNLTAIHLEDMIAAQWNSTFVGVTSLPAVTVAGGDGITVDPTANPSFDGDTNTDILNNDGELAPGEFIVVEMTVEVNTSETGPSLLYNQATAQGTDPLSNDIMDLSDDNTSSTLAADPNGDNPNGAGDNGTGDTNSPTPLLIGDIGLAKTITNVTPSVTPGNFDVTYQLNLQNTGTTVLENITLTDNDITTTFGSAYVGEVSSPAVVGGSGTAPATINSLPNIYDGTSGLLLPSQNIVVEFTVEIDASEVSVAGITNQAEVSALPTDGMGNPIADANNPGGNLAAVSDLSDSGTDATTANAGEPGDTGGFDDPTPLPPLASVSLTKTISSLVDPGTQGKVGNVDVEYTMTVKNIGNTYLNSVSLVDNFEMQLDGSFEGIIGTPATTVGGINPSYTGSNIDSELLDGTALLAPGETIEVVVTVNVDPDNEEGDFNIFGELQNQAFVSASPSDAMGNPIMYDGNPIGDVNDASDTGTDPDTDNDGEPNDAVGGTPTYDDPTILRVPSITIAKEIFQVQNADSGIEGNFDVSLRYYVTNDGNVDLSNLSLMEDITGQYGTAFIGIVQPTVLLNNTATTGPTLDGAYSGTGDLLSPMATDRLASNQGFVAEIIIEVDASEAADTLWNQATVAAQPLDRMDMPVGMPISDASDSGSNPETDNPLEEDDMGTAEDPTSLVLPNISVSKQLLGFVETVNGDYGNVDLTFEFTISNSGNTTLYNTQLNDNFVAVLGSGFVTLNDVQITASTATVTPTLNIAYNGSAPGNIFTGADGELAPGEAVTVQVEIEFNPIAPGLLSPLVNVATAFAEDGDGNQIVDTSDDGTDPEDENSDAPGQGTGPNVFDDPTPVEVPRVYATKALTSIERAASNIVGNYDLTFSLKVQNTGNVDLDSIQFVDDMVTQFGSSFVEVISTAYGPATDANANPSLNPAFIGGASDGNIFTGVDGAFSTLQTVEVIVVVEVDPDATGAPSDLTFNSAEAFATDSRDNSVSDLSDDGTEPLTENTGSPGDDPLVNPSVDDPTPIVIPSINAAKKLVSISEAESDVEGNVDAVFTVVIENTGNVALDSISLEDDLATQLGDAFVGLVDGPAIVSSTATSDPVINVDYDGTEDNSNFFDEESGQLLSNESIVVEITVEINPNAAGAITPLTNQAIASGYDSAGTEASDESDSGSIAEDNNIDQPGDTGGQDDATLLELPSISVAKSVKEFTRLAQSGIVGNFDVTFRFEVQNTGNVDIENINLYDDVATQLGAAYVRIVPQAELGYDNPLVTNIDSDSAPTANVAYDGGTTDDNVLNGDGTFAQDQSFVVELVVEINPNNFAAPDTLYNQATAEATYVSIADGDIIVSDDSDSGVDAESNGAGQPNDSGASDDETPIILSDINVSKQITNVVDAKSDIEGNVDVTFEFLIKNKGNDTLTTIQLNDDIQSQYGPAFVQTVGPAAIDPMVSTATELPTLNGSYDGGNNGVFTGTDGVLAPNEFIRVTYTAEIDPDQSIDGNGDMIPDTLYNQADVSSVNSAGSTITDLSDHGDDPESSNPGFEGDTGGMDDVTPLATPVISITKEVVEYNLGATPGNLDVTYRLVVQNTGNVQLENIQVFDTLANLELLGPAHVGISTLPVIANSTADVDPTLNPAFTGFAGSANIFDGISGLLQAGQSFEIVFEGEVDAALAIDPSMLFNQAVAYGENDSDVAQDLSDSGDDPTTNNPDAEVNTPAGAAGPDDPTPVYPCISNCTVACKGDINLSLDPATCETIVTPSMVGADIPVFCNFYYAVTLTDSDGNIIPDNVVTGEYVGETLEYSIEEPECGNSCWGYVTIEFKLPPTIECTPIDTLSCVQAFDEAIVPDVTSNCASVELTKIFEDVETLLCDTSFSAVMTRQWVAVDQYGNISDTCTQEIYLRRTNLDSIVPPSNYLLALDNEFSCSGNYATTSKGFPAPGVTDVPQLRLDDGSFIDMYPFDASVICNGFIEFEDEVILGSTSCVTKIRRTWTVGDWFCSSTNERDFVQIIEIVDFDGPELTCVDDVTVSTSTTSCEASASFALPVAEDACNNDLSYNLSTPVGFYPDYNGGVVVLPVGVHTLKYTVYDGCGISSECTFDVTVQDLSDPIALCDAFTTVGIVYDTVTQVTAAMIDDGSYDECGDVQIQVARMDEPGFDDFTGFGESISIYCTDAGSTVMVGLLVTDAGGNTNMCMASVEVQDKVPAQMTCPTDMTVECDFGYDPNNLEAFFGGVQIYDNCPAANTVVDEIIDEDRNSCGAGSITRRLTLLSPSGEQLQQCFQTITFVNGDPLTESEIEWPMAEVDVTGCGFDAIDPENIGMPIVASQACQLAGIRMENDTFPFTSNGACLKIVRTWFVIDWCQETGPGSIADPFTFEQIIKVSNLESPTIIDLPADTTFCSYAADCGPLTLNNYLVANVTDDCTPSNEILTYFRVEDEDGILVNSGTGLDASGTYDIGEYTVIYEAEDKCGNTTLAETTFEIQNCKLPTPYCKDGLSTSLLAMDTDEDGTADIEMVMLTPEFFDAGSYHSCGYDITLSFSSDVNDTVATFFCSDTIAPVEVELWVTDEFGRQDFCTASLDVQDNNDVDLCVDMTIANVEGRIYTESDAMLNQAEVLLKSTEALLEMTDSDGYYGFMDMPLGGSYIVEPYKNDDVLNGVSTLDLVKIQRHILSVESLDSPYKLIAADINNDNKISSTDLLSLRKVILGIDSDFPNNTSWKFIDQNFEFDDELDPWTAPLAEDYKISTLSDDMWIDFIAVKIGDVNGNVSANVEAGIISETRSNNSFNFSLPNTSLENGQVYEIIVAADDNAELYGLQNNFELNNIELVDVLPGVLNISSEMMAVTTDGIKLSYSAPNGVDVTKGQELFTLVVKAKASSNLADMISISSKELNAEAYLSNELRVATPEIRWSEEFVETNPVGVFEMVGVTPNPWKSNTAIKFMMPEAGNVKFIVRNAEGRNVIFKSYEFKAGLQSIEISNADLQHNGIYFIDIIYNNKVINDKMIKIE